MFDPYGKVTVLDGNGTPRTVNESAYGNPWTFTGRRLDGETGLMYYRWRMYSVELGRFIERDPIGYEGSKWDLYEYVSGKPTTAADPSGLTLVAAKGSHNAVSDTLKELCQEGNWQMDASGNITPLDENFCTWKLCGKWHRTCEDSKHPKSCCCICEAIRSSYTTTVTYDPNTESQTSKDLKSSISYTAQSGYPSWVTLGHELCGHVVAQKIHPPKKWRDGPKDPVWVIEQEIIKEHKND